MELHADKSAKASAAQGAEPDHLADLLRTLEPESKRKM
jgi:hypothetical protein